MNAVLWEFKSYSTLPSLKSTSSFLPSYKIGAMNITLTIGMTVKLKQLDDVPSGTVLQIAPAAIFSANFFL
jgi:hypothetical protein